MRNLYMYELSSVNHVLYAALLPDKCGKYIKEENMKKYVYVGNTYFLMKELVH